MLISSEEVKEYCLEKISLLTKLKDTGKVHTEGNLHIIEGCIQALTEVSIFFSKDEPLENDCQMEVLQ